MSGYRLSRQADRTLADIYFHTAERFGIRQADSYATGMLTTFDLLVTFPTMGRIASNIRPGLRRHEHGSHVIFYRVRDDGLFIVGIIHRRMRPDLDIED